MAEPVTLDADTPDAELPGHDTAVRSRLDLSTAVILVVGGALGLLAAFQLTLEKFRVLADPDYVPACDLNPVLSCGSVIITPQAEVFGFPNPIMGLVGFTVVITLGVLLLARVTLPRWVWLGLNIGALAGFAFVQWLVWQSLYSIGSLCPWCMVVWTATAPIVVWVTAANLSAGRWGISGAGVDAVVSLRWLILAAWYLIVLGLIFLRWQDYWLGN
jgi:uncharacterized membrane protein